jgi:hypothetical protein
LAIPPLAAYVFLKDEVWTPSINWLTTSLTDPPQVLLRIHLLLALLFIPFSFYSGCRIYKYIYWRKKRRFFFEYGYYWCFNRNKNELEEIPYCKKHRVQLTEMKFGYICFDCRRNKKIKEKEREKILEHTDRKNIYFIIKQSIMAKVEGYHK